MVSEEKETNLRTEEVNEILTSTPKWIFRWGITVMLGLIISTIALCCWIRYPDILTADVTLTTLNPPVTLVSNSNGKITHLLTSNNQQVHINTPIAVIENTASYKDVLYLFKICSALLNNLKKNDTITPFTIEENLVVGELTPDYTLILNTAKDINLYRKINSANRQIGLLKKDLVNYSDLLKKYKKQVSINTQQLILVEADYNRDKTLYGNAVISAREIDAKKKEYLSALNSNESIKIVLSNTLIQINLIEKSILQLQLQDYQEQAKLKNDFHNHLESLLAQIIKWKQSYLIESPIEGKVSFFNVWVVNQNVKSGDQLFTIVPDVKQQFIAKCTLPVINTGKLGIGQNVNIKLDHYPYSENGMLKGIVTNISEVPNNDTYSVDVKLTNGLVTTYHKTLVYKEQMKGKADIITQNASVMHILSLNFKKIVNRN